MTPLRLLPLGEWAWVLGVSEDQALDPLSPSIPLNPLREALRGLLAPLRAEVDQGLWPGVQEVVPGLATLTVFWAPGCTDLDAQGQRLQRWAQARLAQNVTAPAVTPRRWCLPVCLDDDLALDLMALSQACSVSPEVLRHALTHTVFTVDVLGFLPGFAYLRGWPAPLARPRRATPRVRVPAGALAVAEDLCAVYPQDSPGGWHVLGGMPLPLFDSHHPDGPAWFAPGDEVCWQAVDAATFAQLRQQAARGPVDRRAWLRSSAT